MENINAFLEALIKLGVPKHETFQTVDLYEGKNVVQVVDCIFAFSRHAVAAGFQGPLLGPKLAEKRVVLFDLSCFRFQTAFTRATFAMLETLFYRRAAQSWKIVFDATNFW